MKDAVFKIFTEKEWLSFSNIGIFEGTDLDLADGFIHMSTEIQVDGVLKKFFAGIRPLYIAKFDSPRILQKLVWENRDPSNLFPHLYEDILKYIEVVDYEKLES